MLPFPSCVPQRCVDCTEESIGSLWDPCYMTEALTLAVTQRRPRPQYLVGLDAKFKVPAARMLPVRVIHAVIQSAAYYTLRPVAAHPVGEAAV